LKPISVEHWLGTDKEGRDILSRILFGARSTLGGAALVVLISSLIGIPLGLISAFYGGWLDSLITRLWDLVLAFPPLLLAFVIVAAFGRGSFTAIVALGIVYTPMISRVARSAALAERQKPYIEATRSIGSRNLRILRLHILPNCLTSLIVQSTLDIGYAILDLAALSFLGLSVQPPTADWGAMLAHGQSYLFIAPNAALASGFCIMLAVVSFSLLGDGLASYFDPRQRR
jgi:peptide/nickel transport system permease protein